MKFPFQQYIVCWGKIYGSKIICGGPPRATSAFYSVKLCNSVGGLLVDGGLFLLDLSIFDELTCKWQFSNSFFS